MSQQRGLEIFRHRLRVAMGAAQGLTQHLVDETELGDPVRGDAHRLRREFLLVCALPEDRGAPLGRDYRIYGVLQHQQAVADADRERAARAPFTDYGRYHGHTEPRHLEQVARDRLALVALLRPDPGIRARCIDQRDNWQPEALRSLHEPQRLTVSLRLGHAVVAAPAPLLCASLLMPDQHPRSSLEPRWTTYDRQVVGIHPVAVHLLEVIEDRRG